MIASCIITSLEYGLLHKPLVLDTQNWKYKRMGRWGLNSVQLHSNKVNEKTLRTTIYTSM